MSHEIQALSLWELKQGATAMQEALKLERERAAYFQFLYDDIGCSRSRFGDTTDEPGPPSSVEAQALNIIDAKSAYDRRIQKKREKYTRWLAFLGMVHPNTADLLKRHFEHGQPVDSDLLQRAIRDGAAEWEDLEYGRGKFLDEEALDYLTYMRERFPELFRPKQRNYGYLIDGEIVYMTIDQHESYLLKKKWEEQKQAMADMRHRTANEYSNALYQ